MTTFSLRKDHADHDTFHLLQRYQSKYRDTSIYVTNFHVDSVAELFGDRIAELAADLRPGESMPIEVVATCPDDNEIDTDLATPADEAILERAAP